MKLFKNNFSFSRRSDLTSIFNYYFYRTVLSETLGGAVAKQRNTQQNESQSSCCVFPAVALTGVCTCEVGCRTDRVVTPMSPHAVCVSVCETLWGQFERSTQKIGPTVVGWQAGWVRGCESRVSLSELIASSVVECEKFKMSTLAADYWVTTSPVLVINKHRILSN